MLDPNNSNPFNKSSNAVIQPQLNKPSVCAREYDICFICFALGLWSRDCTLPCKRKYSKVGLEKKFSEIRFTINRLQLVQFSSIG